MSPYTNSELLRFVEENDVKFIRLAFCDIFGTQKNITIMADGLAHALNDGIGFDASAIQGFMNVECSDLLLFPDPSTLAVLPWRPSQGRVIRFFCDIRYTDGRPFEGDGRRMLQAAEQEASDLGYSLQIGLECEFYLFQLDDDGLPTHIPHDNASYLDVGPFDKGENVRRQICLTLEEMNIRPESSLHEGGPGQNEIVLHHENPLKIADDLITLRNVVKTVAASNGLHASFMPKPLHDKAGSGLHTNISLHKKGSNLLSGGLENSAESLSFTAGLITRCREMTAFFNPLVNSYDRFGSYEAPRFITWSHQNRSQLIRIPGDSDDRSRLELRSPDPAINPYLAFTLLIHAGLEGIRRDLKLFAPCDINLYEAPYSVTREYDTLPVNLKQAVKAARESAFVRQVLPEKIVNSYLNAKSSEWERYSAAQDKSSMTDSMYFYSI